MNVEPLIVQTHESSMLEFAISERTQQPRIGAKGPSTAFAFEGHIDNTAIDDITAWWIAVSTGLSVEEAVERLAQFKRNNPPLSESDR